VLIDAVSRQSPPRNGVFRPKPRYAHQGGRNPPLIVIHGNMLDKLPDSYCRYLENVFREVFKLQGTPLRIQFKTTENPYARDADAPRKKPRAEEKGAAGKAAIARTAKRGGAGTRSISRPGRKKA
jgi:GTP-binding protein